MNGDCIFCKIIEGTIPSYRIYEDAETLAFMDINPANDGHALVVPKEHAPDIFSLSTAALTAAIGSAQKVAVAVQKVLAPSGINLVQANGPGAAQSVLHFHIHVLPRQPADGLALNWTLTPGDKERIADLAERIRAAI